MRQKNSQYDKFKHLPWTPPWSTSAIKDVRQKCVENSGQYSSRQSELKFPQPLKFDSRIRSFSPSSSISSSSSRSQTRSNLPSIDEKFILISSLPLERTLSSNNSIMSGYPNFSEDKGEFQYPSAYDVSTRTSQESHSLYEHRLYRVGSIFSRTPTLSFDIERGGSIYPGPLPRRYNTDIWPKFRYTVFTAYRRLFTFIFLANLTGFIYLITNLDTTPRINYLSTAVAVNLMVAVLIRQDFVINFLFEVFARTPKWFPLRIRKAIGKLYEYGGVHSGCAVAATLWYLFLTEEITRSYIMARSRGVTFRSMTQNLVLTWIPLVLLLWIVLFAQPWFRRRFHDSFEYTHRFGGWSALIIIWAQSIALADATRGPMTLGQSLIRSPAFWFLTIITICIILPWLRLKKVTVRAERLSHHATRLHFDVPVGFCQGLTVSDRPLFEWHAFAALPSEDGKGCSILVSNAGDWTKRQIYQGPHKLWLRGIPRTGVLRIAPIFKSAVLIATGSGIGPQLSFLLGCGNRLEYRLIWSTPEPEKTYGKAVIDLVHQVDPRAIIIDTRKTGRPDLVSMAYELYVRMGAEAIFVISNQRITRQIVYAMESRGIPAYGPVFDS